ncbi:MAG: hypothetical protein L0215_21700 [Gemmataceae bacterium]|nr:hypothetical protein [Gemmataceae bacterium]
MKLIDQLEALKSRIVGLCRSNHDGDDLYQDVWIRCRVSVTEQFWRNPQPALIMTIARNLLRDHQRRRECERKFLAGIASKGDEQFLTKSCGADVEEREARQSLRSAICRLPDRYRMCIELVLEQSGTSESNAAFLGMEPSTFRTRTRRARAKLRSLVFADMSTLGRHTTIQSNCK